MNNKKEISVLKDSRKDAISECAKLPEEAKARLEGVAIGLLLAYEKQAKSEKT